jgi:hypothetical protein
MTTPDRTTRLVLARLAELEARIADDAQLATALQTIALAWGWCDGALPERL